MSIRTCRLCASASRNFAQGLKFRGASKFERKKKIVSMDKIRHYIPFFLDKSLEGNNFTVNYALFIDKYLFICR